MQQFFSVGLSALWGRVRFYTQRCVDLQPTCTGLISDGAFSPFRPFRAGFSVGLSALLGECGAITSDGAARQTPLLPLVTVSYRCRHLSTARECGGLWQTVWCCKAHTPASATRRRGKLFCAQTMSDRSDWSDWSDLSAAFAAATTIVDMRTTRQHSRAAANCGIRCHAAFICTARATAALHRLLRTHP